MENTKKSKNNRITSLEVIKYSYTKIPVNISSTYGIKHLDRGGIVNLSKGIFLDKGKNYITEDICLLESLDYENNTYYFRNVIPNETLILAISPYEIFGATLSDGRKPYKLEDVFKIGEYVLAGTFDKHRVVGSTSVPPSVDKNVAVIKSIDLNSWTVEVEYSYPSRNQGSELLDAIATGLKLEVQPENIPSLPSYPSDLVEGVFSLKALLRSPNTYYYNYDKLNPNSFKDSLKGLVVFIGNSYYSMGFINENNTILPINRFYHLNDSYSDNAVGFISEVIESPIAGEYLAKVSFFTNINKDFIENFEFKGTKYLDPKYDNFPEVDALARSNEIVEGTSDHNVGGGLVQVNLKGPSGTDTLVKSLGYYNTFSKVTGTGANRSNPVFLRQYASITNLRYINYILSKRDYPTVV